MPPPIPSQLDGNQILQASFIETTGSLRTNATATIIGGDLTVETNHTHDSMALGDTVNLFTSTQVSSKNGLDVAIINTPTVSAIQSGNWDLRNITGTVSLPTGAAAESTLSSLNTKIPSGLTVTSTRLLVDASGTIQPVSGTVTVNQGTSPWITTATQAGSWTVGRTWTLSNTTDSVASVQSGTWNLNNITGTISLPTGASTSALQTSGNTSLSSIDSKIPSGLTVTATRLVVDGSGTIQPVSGTVAVSNFPATQAVTQSTSPWVVSGTVTSNQGTSPWVISGSTGRTWTLASGTDSVTSIQGTSPWVVSGTVAVTQTTSPWVISGSVTANAGTNLNTSALTLDTSVVALQVAQSSSTTSQKGTLILGAVTTAAPIYTTGQSNPFSLTTTGALRVDSSGSTGTVTANQGTSPWVVSGTVNAAQSGTWTTGRTWTLLSGSDSIASVQSGVWNITNITGTISLPTGASTSALQTTGNSSLSSIDSKTPALGQAVMASSSPVVIASNQSAIPVSGSVSVSNFPATQPVSGTVAVTQSTSPWVTSRNWTLASGTDSISSVQSGTWSVTANAGTNLNTSALALDTTVAALQVSQASTTSGQKGGLQLGAVTTAAPAYTTAQTSPLSLTTSGALRTDSSGSTQPVSGTIAATQSGTWNIGTLTTITNPVAVTQSTSPWVVNGTINSVQSGTWNLNNITGTISLPTGASTEATLAKLTLAQGSTTSGQVGTLIFGAVTTAAPTYTNAQSNVLSLTTSGLLRIDGSGSTQPISGTVTANAGTGTFQTNVTNTSIPVTQSGTWTTGRTWTLSSGTDSISAAISNFPATQAVTQSTSPWVISGTITANAGTNLNTSALALDTSVNGLLRAQASTTSGQTGPIIQGAVTTASPIYTTGQTNPLSLTTTGALRVDTSGTTASQNITQFGGTNLSTGTGASGTGIPRVTIANDSNILATQSGTWNITNISGTISLPTGASTSALQTTGNTSLTSIQTTSNSTAVNTSTIASNQTNGNQRTLVSDLVGNLLPSGDAAARSIFMRISDGTNNVLTTTINSRVRLDVNVASEGTDGSAVPFQTIQVGGRDGSGNLQTIATDTSGNQFISSRIPLTASAPTFATIGVTSGTVIVTNANRKGLVIQNTSSLATISLNLVGGSAVLNSGITLYPHDIFYMDEFTFTTAQIDAISSLASTNVSVQEVA